MNKLKTKPKTMEEKFEEVWEDAYYNAYERNGGDEDMATESADWVLSEYKEQLKRQAEEE
jgi:hypothetical protein